MPENENGNGEEQLEQTLVYKGALRDFSAIPNILFRAGKAISPAALRVWGTMVMHAQGKGSCFLGIKKLSAETGLDRKAVFKALDELEWRKMLKRERTGRANRYVLYDPIPKWLFREGKKLNQKLELMRCTGIGTSEVPESVL
jgi:DNA-binding MarR family transcriptional regulator